MCPRTEKYQPTLKTRNLNPITQLRIAFQRIFVRHELDANHQAHAAHVADTIMLALEFLQPGFEVSTYFRRKSF